MKKKRIKLLMALSLILFIIFSLALHYTSGKGLGPLSWLEIIKYSWITILASIVTAFFIVDAIDDEKK
ncbi:MAG: hypothetical protein J6P65_03715 [Bacteroidales bacterium]|nr:hypothetical protein [Bacteroidales bacterium]